MLSKKELWEKAGSSIPITREDIGVKQGDPNSLSQSFRESIIMKPNKEDTEHGTEILKTLGRKRNKL